MNELRGAIFIDTAYWISLLVARDNHHRRARAWMNWLEHSSVKLVTTEFVWWETLNALSSRKTRSKAVTVYESSRSLGTLKTIGFDEELIESALAMYRSHDDKDWSLTDCFSFSVMAGSKITVALTTDRHFAQAGLRALLLEEPPG